jgi:hypothetical protein
MFWPISEAISAKSISSKIGFIAFLKYVNFIGNFNSFLEIRNDVHRTVAWRSTSQLRRVRPPTSGRGASTPVRAAPWRQHARIRFGIAVLVPVSGRWVSPFQRWKPCIGLGRSWPT